MNMNQCIVQNLIGTKMNQVMDANMIIKIRKSMTSAATKAKMK